MIIAVDFDGTIVSNKYPEIGEEYPFATDTPPLKCLLMSATGSFSGLYGKVNFLTKLWNGARKEVWNFWAVNMTTPEENGSLNNNHFSGKIKADIPLSMIKTWADLLTGDKSNT